MTGATSGGMLNHPKHLISFDFFCGGLYSKCLSFLCDVMFYLSPVFICNCILFYSLLCVCSISVSCSQVHTMYSDVFISQYTTSIFFDVSVIFSFFTKNHMMVDQFSIFNDTTDSKSLSVSSPNFFLLGLSGVKSIEIMVCGTLNGYKYLKNKKI